VRIAFETELRLAQRIEERPYTEYAQSGGQLPSTAELAAGVYPKRSTLSFIEP
jgi:hypothetical protein